MACTQSECKCDLKHVKFPQKLQNFQQNLITISLFAEDEDEKRDVPPVASRFRRSCSSLHPFLSEPVKLSLPLTGKASFPEADVNQRHRGKRSGHSACKRTRE